MTSTTLSVNKVDINDINNEINKLESAETNWTNIQRLSWLYSVKNNLGTDVLEDRITVSVMPNYGGDFGSAVSGVKIDDLMSILSEHMSVVKILHPKEYDAVIEKIKSIP